MGRENTDGREIRNFFLAIAAAHTRRGRYLKVTTFLISFISSLLIPMGVVVIYFLWKHGDKMMREAKEDVSPVA